VGQAWAVATGRSAISLIYQSSAMQDAIDRALRGNSFDVIQMENYPLGMYRLDAAGGALHVLDAQNVEYDSAERAARKGLHVVSLDPPAQTRTFVDRYRQVWRETRGPKSALPNIGLGRFIVVANTDEEAIRIAPPKWHRANIICAARRCSSAAAVRINARSDRPGIAGSP
jgi:hypothetical protein